MSKVTIFNRIREEIQKSDNSGELSIAVNEGINGVRNLMEGIIGNIEEEAGNDFRSAMDVLYEKMDEHNKLAIQKFIEVLENSIREHTHFIKNIGVIALDGEEKLNSEEREFLYRNVLDMRLEAAIQTLNLNLGSITNEEYSEDFEKYVIAKKEEIENIVKDKKIELGLEMKEVTSIK